MNRLPPKVKLYRCRAPGCDALFIKRQSMQTWCSIPCGLQIGLARLERSKAAIKRAEGAIDREKREAMKTLPMLKAEVKNAMHPWVKLRDRAAGFPCISCGGPLQWDVPGGAVDAGHYRSVGSAPHLRFDERNVHAQCVHCNQFLAGNPIGYEKGLIGRIGLEAVLALKADNEPKRYTRDDLRALRDDYRQRVRAMKGGK